MTKQPHKPSGKQHQGHKPKQRPPHKDWRAWVVVGLMLAGIAGYILSLDDSIEPGGGDGRQVPAAAAP